MTPLQQRVIEDLQLRGMSARTEQMYVRAVRRQFTILPSGEKLEDNNPEQRGAALDHS